MITCERLFAAAARAARRSTAAAGSSSSAAAQQQQAQQQKAKQPVVQQTQQQAQQPVVQQQAQQLAGQQRAAPSPAEVEALARAMAHLNKKHGSGTIMRLGEAHLQSPLQVIPSGCLTLDLALGGGWPRGRIVEVFGPESSGKTTLALHAIAEVQKAGGQAVLVDAEHAFNKDFARRLGVDVQALPVSQPSCGEEALEVVDTLLRSHAVRFVAVDSVAALLPRAELTGEIGNAQLAGQARLMSMALRKLAANAAKADATVMFINQLRYKVGVMFGSPETTSGGTALKFYASQRVDVRVKDKSDTGIRVRAKVVKNKVAPPYRSTEFFLAFNRGIEPHEQLLDASLALGLLTARGAHYYAAGERVAHGRSAAVATIAADDRLRATLLEGVRAALADPAALEAALDLDAAGGGRRRSSTGSRSGGEDAAEEEDEEAAGGL